MSKVKYEISSVGDKDKVRFWSKVEIGNPDECWEWMRGKDKDGYGLFSLKCYPIFAHVFSLLLKEGVIYEEKKALHSCDNPSCVNPFHLRSGTHKENMNDRQSKNRQARHLGDDNPSRTRPECLRRGVDHHKAKMNPDKVREMRFRFSQEKFSYARIGLEYGICAMVAYKIINRRSWKHVA